MNSGKGFLKKKEKKKKKNILPSQLPQTIGLIVLGCSDYYNVSVLEYLLITELAPKHFFRSNDFHLPSLLVICCLMGAVWKTDNYLLAENAFIG